MEWNDIGYVVGLSNYGENDRIVTLLTRDHGRQNGYLRGARGSLHRGNWQLGNLLKAKWRARLESQLGHLSGEIIEQNAAKWLENRLRLSAMVAACELICRYTPERDPESSIFPAFAELLNDLTETDNDRCLLGYLRFEFSLIAALGYGFDLAQNARQGENDQAQQPSEKMAKIRDGFRLCGNYLDRIEQGGSYAAFSTKPMARLRLIDLMARQQGNG